MNIEISDYLQFPDFEFFSKLLERSNTGNPVVKSIFLQTKEDAIEYMKHKRKVTFIKKFEPEYLYLNSDFENKLGYKFVLFVLQQVIGWGLGVEVRLIRKCDIEKLLRLHNFTVYHYGEDLCGGGLVIDEEEKLVRGITDRFATDNSFVDQYMIFDELFNNSLMREETTTSNFHFNMPVVQFNLIRNRDNELFECTINDVVQMVKVSNKNGRVSKIRVGRKPSVHKAAKKLLDLVL